MTFLVSCIREFHLFIPTYDRDILSTFLLLRVLTSDQMSDIPWCRLTPTPWLSPALLIILSFVAIVSKRVATALKISERYELDTILYTVPVTRFSFKIIYIRFITFYSYDTWYPAASNISNTSPSIAIFSLGP